MTAWGRGRGRGRVGVTAWGGRRGRGRYDCMGRGKGGGIAPTPRTHIYTLTRANYCFLHTGDDKATPLPPSRAPS